MVETWKKKGIHIPLSFREDDDNWIMIHVIVYSCYLEYFSENQR